LDRPCRRISRIADRRKAADFKSERSCGMMLGMGSKDKGQREKKKPKKEVPKIPATRVIGKS
jgi:hypothetical protein